jgi:DNA-binding NarL/FixJ family response regulator
VRNHLKAIFKKLGVRSQPQLIESCRRANLAMRFAPEGGLPATNA